MTYGKEVLKGRTVLWIDIGFDEFRISKNSSQCGWPILEAFVDEPLVPLIIGMYVGKSEPKLIDLFLEAKMQKSRS